MRTETDTLLVIAIDGPAASGKGTLARRLADHYGLPHLDTGLTYRAVARALRRHQDAPEVSYDDVLADIARRDARDMGRTDSPLRPADDAHLLDTTQMDIEAAFQAAKILIDDRLAARAQS